MSPRNATVSSERFCFAGHVFKLQKLRKQMVNNEIQMFLCAVC